MDTNTKIWLIPSIIFGAITYAMGRSTGWGAPWYWYALVFAVPTTGAVIGLLAGMQGLKTQQAIREMNERDKNRER